MLRRGSRGKDVDWVQFKLNAIGQSAQAKLGPDGIFGLKTDARVKEFQQKNMLKADGIVGPNTMAKLKAANIDYGPALPQNFDPKQPPSGDAAVEGAGAGFAPTTSPEESTESPGSPNAPRQLTRNDIKDLNFKSPYYWEAGAFGTAKAGNIFLGFDGRRLIYEVLEGAVVYLVVNGKPDKVGKFFAQTKKGFINDVENYPISSGAKAAGGMKTLAEFEAAVLMGMACTINWTGFIVITGVDLLRFAVTHGPQFNNYKRAFEAVMKAQTVLKTHAPTLYEKLVKKILVSVGSNIPSSAVNDPEIIGKMIGTMIVKFGKAGTASRLGALGYVFTMLWDLAVAAVKSVPGAGVKSAEQIAEEIVIEMRKEGLNISPADAKQIVAEIQRNPRAVEQALNQLNQAFSVIR